LNEYLPHIPWWFLAVAAVGGIGAFFVGWRRLDGKLQRAGIFIFLITALLMGVRMLFPTAAERMEKRTRDLVAAVDRQDWNALQSLLDDPTAVTTPSRGLAAGRGNVVAMTRDAWDRFGMKSVTVTGVEGRRTQTLITVSLDVLSVQDATQGQPMPSSWQLDFQQSGDDWILEKITLLRVGQYSGDQVIGPLSGN
jgi:hypothetical protein